MTNAATKIDFADELWRMFPHTYAEKLSVNSDELWVPYDYLKIVSRRIAEMVANGGGKLIVEMPPRHGKSTLISKWVPVWFLDLFPNKKVMLATYEAGFSAKWGRAVRNEIQSNPGVHVKIAQDSSASAKWDTTAGGGMVTAGIGGPVTGKGGHLIIIDDPVKNWEEAKSETYRQRNIDWMKSTMRTRLEPGGVVVVLQTRWHEGDLAGELQKQKLGYEVISIPAIAEEGDVLGRPVGAALCPERYDVKDLLEIKAEIGTKFFNALFQQRPAPEEGDIFKRHWWRFYNQLPENIDKWIQSWDMTFKDSKKSDFVAGGMLGRAQANIYIADVLNERLSFTGSIRAIEQKKEKWPETDEIIIEDKANGPAIIDTLKSKIQGIIAFDPKADKVSRAYAVQPMVEAGNVWLPDPKKHPWVEPFIEQCAVFPNGSNDDMVDMLTQGLLRLRQKKDTVLSSPVGIFKSSSWR